MRKVHVLLITWTSQGHLTPLLQLARFLSSQHDFLISLALPANARTRFQQASSPLPHLPNLHIHTLDDGLPPDLSHAPSFEQIIASVPIMQQSLDQLLGDSLASPSPVTCLIAGTFCFWTQPVARKFNIPRAEVWSSPAYAYCCGFFYPRLLSAGLVPFKGEREDTWITCIPGLPPVRASDYITEHIPSDEEVQADPEKIPKTRELLAEVFGNARDQFRILVNSIHDLESQAFDALRSEHIPACAIGPLFLHDVPIEAADQAFNYQRTTLYKDDQMCLPWLGRKASLSTMYVAFGSESVMDKHDMEELAYGLEASGQSFLWVVRPGSIVGGLCMEDVLPEGFRENVGERGLVVAWAPQTDVLAHPAIGAFLSHCGWNSMLESLWFGTPMLAWPQRVDQRLNKKHIVEEWKVGIAVEKNEVGKVTRMSVETGVRSLLGGKESAEVRQRVKEMKETMFKAVQDGGMSRTNLHQFIEDLRNLSRAQDSESA